MIRKFPAILLLLLIVGCASKPYRYTHREMKDPPQQLHIVKVDLTDKRVHLRVVPGGEDPDGPGEWQTVLTPPTRIAEREHLDVVVNGDFFMVGRKDVEGAAAQAVYVKGIPASVVGPAVTDGNLWGPALKSRPALIIHGDRRMTIEEIDTPPPDADQVIAGSDILVRNGENVAPKGKGFPDGPHPRTAVGIANDGKRLILVVGDGRKPGVAKGWSLSDLADVMIDLGCEDAVNLDGGGSSMMGIRDPKTHKMQIVNTPSDGKERSVANVLGVIVTPKR